MHVTDLDLPLDLASYRPHTMRGESLPHLTTIRDWLDERLGLSGKNPSYEGWEAAAAIGFFFEEAMGRALSDYGGERFGLIPGVELEKDGILMSPDRLHPDTMEPWDFKFTWRGLRKSPPEAIWKWMTQLKGYCSGLGVESGVIVALYACGDYAPPQPRLVSRRFFFTQQELAENWLMLQNGWKAMQGAGGIR